MLIGLLSDTHGFLDNKIFSYFDQCDEIWHAGDLGDDVADKLERFKPLRAIHGNIDSKEMRVRYPEDLWFKLEGFLIWMTHIGGSPPNYNPRVRKILKEQVPDIFICGHSHILKISRDRQYNNMLYLNPGAAGNQGFHQMKTLIRLELRESQILQMEVIEIGKRGAVV